MSDPAAYVGGAVIWQQYMFARHWFKINLTTDLDGRIVETAAMSPAAASPLTSPSHKLRC